VSYLGLLPALGILRPATEHPERRNALMIVAHLIWGSITGLIVARMQPHD
jgi:putative membrane protein